MSELITGINCIYAGIGLAVFGVLGFFITTIAFAAKKKKIIEALSNDL